MTRKPLGRRSAYLFVGLGIVVVIAGISVGLRFPGLWRTLQVYGYLGAFAISVVGSATILVPVPMLPVVAGLGATLQYPALVGLAAAAGETIGALSIYATGHGGGRALLDNRTGRLQRLSERMERLMERRGWLALLIASTVLSPLFYPVALTSGALRYGTRRFVAVVFVGKLIKWMVVVYTAYYGIHGLLRIFRG